MRHTELLDPFADDEFAIQRDAKDIPANGPDPMGLNARICSELFEPLDMFLSANRNDGSGLGLSE